ncbi:MAG: hypothetical protein A2V81_00030 [Candidatus Abawacabacteria bacterium RBG_16_42_10]|uniref:Uncharacterized protein n=1 Tax=Candidatus Abawacabacteria bacterium RBG_16_42_10 TaxID=1817814 RepID=A0A1F4XL51_9BACT|nr:MAG: hypothetical protein A2V81_00030 [Candidatus Abawacabacteria bacterium RBG_16_42_10]
MKNLLEKFPRSNSIRALVLAVLGATGCTYNNTYNYYGESPDGGDVLVDGSRDSDGSRTDAGVDTTRDGSLVDSGSDTADAGDTSGDAATDGRDAAVDGDAGAVRCRSFGFPGLRAPNHVGDIVPVRIWTYDDVPASTYGINNVRATGSVDTSSATPFMTAPVTEAGTRNITAFVLDLAGRRSDCDTGSYPVSLTFVE